MATTGADGTSERLGGQTVTVSVIIPARNEEGYVEQALDSVVAQSYPLDRIECLVVDNGSTDRTGEMALAFGAGHPELRLAVVREPVLGTGAAKNRGGRSAQGEVLVFLDADSRMEPDLLSTIVAQHQAGDPAGCIRIVADSDDWLERKFFELNELGKILFGIRTQMMYCNRSLFLAAGGFRTELQVAEDLEFLQRVKRQLKKRKGRGKVAYVTSSWIATSPRRLRGRPLRLGVFLLFFRWALAFARIGRRWRY